MLELFGNGADMLPSAQPALTQALTVLGDADAAIAQLAASLREPSGTTIALLRLDPPWDPLRKTRKVFSEP